MKNVKIITVESDFGAGTRGAKLGPQALLKSIKKINASLLKDIPVSTVSSAELEYNESEEFAKNIDNITIIENKIIDLVELAFTANSFPFIISGDHSNGLGGLSALKNHYPDKKIGVIWIDAHADLHTPYSTPSGNMHGMPLGAALGIASTENNVNAINDEVAQKWESLMSLGNNFIKPKIAPQDLVFIDIRDLEEQEFSLIHQLNIKHFLPTDIKQNGIKSTIEQSLTYLAHCDYLYVSFDVDSIDPTISFGTGTPVPGGLSKEEAKEIIQCMLDQPKLKVFEITEINPLLDRNNPMEDVMAEIMVEVLSSKLL